MYLEEEKALICLNLLVEGCSVRSIERITGVHRDTVIDLLLTVGKKCEQLLEEKIQRMSVQDVQVDEVWAFIQMKEKTKRHHQLTDDTIGDAYTFIALDRDTKLILCWHLGRRTVKDTELFIEKLGRATSARFQLTTDGYSAYTEAISYGLGTQVDYAQLVKIYAQTSDSERRYSPAECVGAQKRVMIGTPDADRISTSHVERQNLTIRMQTRRLTRLTNGFSKKKVNLKAALALHFAFYNFCRVHSSIRCTPAMAAHLVPSIWTLKDLLRAATHI
jgi:IS1 family transposase